MHGCGRNNQEETVRKSVSYMVSKGKAFPVQAYRVPGGSKRLMLPEFSDNRHIKVVRLSALRTGRLYPRGYPRYLFQLEAESNPGPSYVVGIDENLSQEEENGLRRFSTDGISIRMSYIIY